jgi:hypothetical protein
MRRYVRGIGALCLAAGLALAGCGKATESIVESTAGGDLDISGETFTFESDADDVLIQGGAGTQLPENFPSDIPLPPGAQIMSATQTPEGSSVMWTWDDITVEAFDAFVASVKAAGYDEEVTTTSMDLGDEGFTRGAILIGKGKTLSISALVSDEAGALTIVVTADSP